jgi:hypothetical protein
MQNNRTTFILGSSLALGIGLSVTTSAFAAIPLLPAATLAGQTIVENDGLLQDAKLSISIGVNQHYDRRLHGNRCRYRLGNCSHYYQGFYYQNPWWMNQHHQTHKKYKHKHMY